MTNDAFMPLYDDKWLRHAIARICARESRRRCVREEIAQECWLWISLAPGGCDRDYYINIARKAAKSASWQNYKDVLGKSDIEDIRESHLHMIAHDLGRPPYYSDGFVQPHAPSRETWYDLKHPGYR